MSYAPTFSAFPGGPAYAAHAPSAPGAAQHAPVYAAPPVAPVQTQTFYVRRTNVFALIGVLVAMVFSFVIVLGGIIGMANCLNSIRKEVVHQFQFHSKPVDLSIFLYPSERDKHQWNNEGNVNQIVSKFHNYNMIFHVFFAVFCMCIRLLRIKGGKNYDRALLGVLVGYSIICLDAYYWSNFDSGTAFVGIFWSAIVLPYFCVAFRAAKDVTSEKARRWLPFHYETVTLVDKPVV